MILTFGKHKGQKFEKTPKSYQNWLTEQSWFKMSKKEIPLHRQSLSGWDGYGKRGQAIYDAIFEQEKSKASKQDCSEGICSCCEGSKYYGI